MAHPALARLADDLSDRECPTYCLLGLLPGAADSRALSFDPPGPALVLPRLGRRCHFKALIRVASSAVRVAPQQGELRQAREAVDAVAPGHPAGRRRMLDDVVGFFQGLAGAREIALHHERIRLVVADIGAPFGAGPVTGAGGACRNLIRLLGQLDASGEVSAVDVEPSEGVEEAGNEGIIADLLG